MQQQLIPITKEVAFEMKVTINRNTKIAITNPLGLIPLFF